MKKVDHVFVLMLENRSFDHFFGLSGYHGIPRPADPDFKPGATDRAACDPPHEFEDVQAQLAGGFDAFQKLAFTPDQIPVLTQLAKEFLLFDNWFSSVPGPTWPNRFFLHCGSSAGLASSPSGADSGKAVQLSWKAFKFENGSIFKRLTDKGLKWRVYHGDIHPQVLAIDGMTSKIFSNKQFRPTYPADPNPETGEFTPSGLAVDLAAGGYDIAYTFIEPNYGVQVDTLFKYGDSQHPCGTVSAGEVLMKHVYEAIRSSDIWEKSALLILWDEHGGFYDSVTPPAVVAPGDKPLCQDRGMTKPDFKFEQLGYRVPAVLVSPLVPSGSLGSEIFKGQSFDHASVVKSLIENFDLGAPLTKRDAEAPSWLKALGTLGAKPATLPEVTPPVDVYLEKANDGFLAGRSVIDAGIEKYRK